MFKNLPKKIIQSIFLMRALDIPIASRIMKECIYLWREFYIKLSIIPEISNYVVSFSYKNITLSSFKTKDLKDIIKVSQEIKQIRSTDINGKKE